MNRQAGTIRGMLDTLEEVGNMARRVSTQEEVAIHDLIRLTKPMMRLINHPITVGELHDKTGKLENAFHLSKDGIASRGVILVDRFETVRSPELRKTTFKGDQLILLRTGEIGILTRYGVFRGGDDYNWDKTWSADYAAADVRSAIDLFGFEVIVEGFIGVFEDALDGVDKKRETLTNRLEEVRELVVSIRPQPVREEWL